MSNCLEKWKIFDSLNEQVKLSIRLAIVFRRHEGVNAIYATTDDEVFSLVNNSKPEKIEILCGQKIEGFEFSPRQDPSIYAISDSAGSVFAWGANEYGQLGLGTNQGTNVPTKISGNLDQQRVVQVSCGLFHTLTLTSDGQVFSFGSNYFGELGLGHHEDKSLPTKVEGPLSGKVVTAIACEGYASLAALSTGEVFAWGFNKHNILALTSNDAESQDVPGKVAGLEGVLISRIECGSYHALALSTNGKIYAWGDSKFGQAGNGSTDPVTIATLVSSALERVEDFAASGSSDEHSPCVALTESNQVYMWGRCYGQNILRPTITSYSNLDEVFATVVHPATTVRPLRPKEISKKINNESLNECLKRLFNDSETADFVFLVEGKKIHVHKLILKMRCAVFKTMFQGDWKESRASEKTIDRNSFNAFYAFLKYFYTDELEIQPDTALELLDLAHFYQMNDLQKKIEALIKTGLTVENAALVFDKAILFGTKDLEAYTFKFCLENLTAVVKSAHYNNLSEQVSKDFIRRVADQGGFKK
ncbi:Hypothetical predicted protein [Cloeon dipterum]|uniref:BTB domain-containing protein n=1 Tax=Cloeon dipterum TaxID=197152 RepID=A0A8S1CBY1_9INSE|nr:Hypothetical predicted protein [Cloeon dipterum]